ncbi:uncharacterized protein MONOS_9867 [Monocercomonoides exilis]|uniref:uncharacterized protein n=1 Tax=Monocercomonoides exilis TaxID=2049356 RepID=UPI003559B478|nr:hypothetical protein MONOS_9867 [Monocercomonoides exilis]|eukprot:MONOS_9867.1-p1 / transcript=MONOS_9867.1 / gene=MONOS_9867 / organism=Monocercomonoides_exilis_PA203 / gene_product=unspecified product / transcript_product=unspecified product / location=Mono_scaffold00423:31983-33653(-) / protein_length=350 / sequence_SO=supercontig / SO=protein_coding / is_pseudo=false
MATLVVEALGLSLLRFVKADAEVGADKQHSVEPEVFSSSPSDGTQLENRRAEEEEADGSLEITSDGCSDEVRKEEKQVKISMNGLTTNEEQDRKGSSISLEKKKSQILDTESLHLMILTDGSAYGYRWFYLERMTVTGELVELCAERERIVGKPHLNLDRQGERMDEFAAIGEVVLQESVPSITLRDATYAIGQPFHQPELSRVPHVQFFSNCREHNITFDCEGKCGVLFQLAGHLIAGVVGFVACERSVELAARTAARALETVAVQMLHCALVSALSLEEKKRMEKRVYGENGAVARGTELGRLDGLGGGLVKSAREKGDLAKAGLCGLLRISATVSLKDSVCSVSKT